MEKSHKCDTCDYVAPEDVFSNPHTWVAALRHCAEKCAPEIMWLIEGMEKLLNDPRYAIGITKRAKISDKTY